MKGQTVVEETLHGPPTLANYKAFLKREFVNDAVADEIFRMYPATSDGDTRAAFIAFDTDYEFANSVHVIAKSTAGAGQKTWLYYFNYPARSKFYEGSGAFHGIELKFPQRMVLSQPLGRAERRRQETRRFDDGILDAVREDRRSQRPGTSPLAGLRLQERLGVGNRARDKAAAYPTH
jgi:carboxylesterase type B